jgi:chloride channel protein, CIC family
MGHSPTPYVIVGMMCCFGSISRAPLAVMLMVAEMTGSVSILAPAMVAVGLAWFIVRRGDDTIYRSQLQSRAAAPAQRLLVGMPLLANVPVHQAMAPPRLVVTAGTPVLVARRQIETVGVPGVPVVDDEGRFEGAVSLDDLMRLGEEADAQTVDTAVDSSAPTVAGSAHLDVALDALITASQHWIPVLDNDRAVIGTIATSDIVRGYRLGLMPSLRQLDGTHDAAGTHDIEITTRSVLVNIPLRHAGLPDGVIVTSIQRGRDLVIPHGDTMLKSGDRLVVIGRSEDIDVLNAIASGSSPRR